MRDRILGLCLIAFGIGVIVAARQLPLPPMGYPLGSGTFPQIIGGLIVLFALLLVLRGGRDEASPVPLLTWRSALGIAATVVYVRLFEEIGLLVSTAVLLVIYALLLQRGRPRILDTVIVPLLMTGAAFALLRILNVPLPAGALI